MAAAGSAGAPAGFMRAMGFCGADDSVRPSELVALSAEHPWVEWGVLCRPDKAGEPRYASDAWMEELGEAMKGPGAGSVRLAAHLCGARVPEVLSGNYRFVQELFALGFRRVQVNATALNGVDTSRLGECVGGLRASMEAVPEVEWIVQRNDETRPLWEALLRDPPANMSMLFDASVGTGVLVEEFPPAPIVAGRVLRVGYAGGLGPKNLAGVLPKVKAAAADPRNTNVWVDMESSLRTKRDGADVFDLDKCRACIEIGVKAGMPGAAAKAAAAAAAEKPGCPCGFTKTSAALLGLALVVGVGAAVFMRSRRR